MPYELFWRLNPRKLEPFRKAYQIKNEQEDYLAWLQGSYIRIAVGSCLDGRKCKYPEQPLSRNSAEKREIPGEEQFIIWADAFNRRFEKETERH